jgi:hypothetical protein
VPVVLLLAILIAVAYLLALRGRGPIDDDYIIYRYARNWVQGFGLVYNESEHVEGFSAPLWVILIALGLLMEVPAPAMSFLGGLVGVILAVTATGLAWRQVNAKSVWFPPALILAASPALAWHAVAGLGTALLAGLLALWLWLWLAANARHQTPWGAAVAIGFAGLLRAEALLFAIPFAYREWRRGRTLCAAISIAPVAVWTTIRLAYYGRLFPVTFLVKRLPLHQDLSYGLRYLWESTLTTGSGFFILMAALILVAPRRDDHLVVRPALVGLLIHGAYVVWAGGDFLELGRFFLPGLPVSAVLASIGLKRLVGSRTTVAGVVVVVALAGLQWPWLKEEGAVPLEHGLLEYRMRLVGETLARATSQDTVIAAAPIGALGWYADRRIVDMLGLTNDTIWRGQPDLSIHAKGHHRYDASWVLSQQPDIVIFANASASLVSNGPGDIRINKWERDLWKSEAFRHDYVPMLLDIPGSFPLFFSLRNGASVPRGSRMLFPEGERTRLRLGR